MIYGYTVLKKESYCNGKPAWRDDAWEQDTVISKVRLFASERERDNAMRLEQKRIYRKYDDIEQDRYDVKPFKTKGTQGKLIISIKQ